jgi:hypothetical protein
MRGGATIKVRSHRHGKVFRALTWRYQMAR